MEHRESIENVSGTKRSCACHGTETSGPAIYFITCDAPDFPVKIGTSTRLQDRVTGLRRSMPYPLLVLATFPGGTNEERRLHIMFARQRLNGEWFSRSPAIFAEIDRLKQIHAAIEADPVRRTIERNRTKGAD